MSEAVETATKLFQRAENLQAFAKVGLYGPQGSGKTTTAMKIAEGLSGLAGGAPIAFIDTETGSDFFVDRMKAAKIEFLQLKTRAFRQLAPAIEEAEKAGAVLVIDSVSHYWDELKKAFQTKLKRKKLQFQDWAIVKEEWRTGYATPFVNSRCHILVCGRVQDIFEDFFDDDGHRDIVKIGSRMRAEKEFGYEPSLVLEMAALTSSLDELKAAKTKRQRAGIAVSSEILIRATVIKDRADLLNGQRFDFPTFEDFLPHFQTLSLGGKHLGVDEKTSEALFSNGSEAFQRIQKQRTIALEEIEEEIKAAYPGSDKASKAVKTDLVNAVFGTRSWTAISEMRLDDLQHGLGIVRAALKILVAQEEPDVEGTVEAVQHEKTEAEDPFE
ncbi:MAG: AAA family ATPase [Candidatus Eisenbacteria sp.]|nr:AAA family ATPase [Candidatus Eisenbacteria bacterium]